MHLYGESNLGLQAGEGWRMEKAVIGFYGRPVSSDRQRVDLWGEGWKVFAALGILRLLFSAADLKKFSP